MPDLETVDILGVEILSTGGPVKGVGSPPEGDHWTSDDLRSMERAAAELPEVKAPAKIGHKGGDPAVGWLENIRVNEDGSKLLADIKRVPKGLSALIHAGAYRTRSVELSKITSQENGRSYDWVVTGLAWLGGKMPAVRTLADVVKLYEGEADAADREFVDIAEVAGPDVEELLDAVADVGRHLAALSSPSGESETPADSRPVEVKYSDEQRRKFAEATGLEAEKVTDEMLAAAGVTDATAPTEPAPAVTDEQVEQRLNELSTEVQEAKADAKRANEELRLERRRSFVEDALHAGKVTPGQRETLEALYDSNEDAARKFVTEAKADEDLSREYGSDDGDVTEEQATEARQLEDATVAQMIGVDAKDLI